MEKKSCDAMFHMNFFFMQYIVLQKKLFTCVSMCGTKKKIVRYVAPCKNVFSCGVRYDTICFYCIGTYHMEINFVQWITSNTNLFLYSATYCVVTYRTKKSVTYVALHEWGTLSFRNWCAHQSFKSLMFHSFVSYLYLIFRFYS